MALKRDTRYPGRFVAATTTQPQGAFKNRSTPTAQDGSYLEADWANDISGFFARVLNVAGVTPNGIIDDGSNSQVYNALLSAMPGRLINRQVLTASGSYVPTIGTKMARIRATGGGGGGGGCPSTGASQQAAANGGQAGAYAEIICNITASSYGITVGGGGTAGGNTGTAGGAGGNTVVTGILTVPGGLGGAAGVASSSAVTLGNNAASTTFPTVTSGTGIILIPSNPGEPFTVIGNLIQQQRGGRGGSNPFGVGGAPGTPGAGSSGRGYGAGGGGCSQFANNTGDVGGVGLGGIIVIEEFS